jgi:uncharacterized RDD family membrane protein YckC
MNEPPGSPSDRRRPPLPARLIGRGAERVAGATGLDRAAEATAEEAIVRAVESEAVERALTRVLEGPALERAVAKALESPAVEESWRRLLASDEAQQLVQRIAEAPEIRAAIASQSAGLLQDLARQAQELARRLDDGLERLVRRILFRHQRAGPTDRSGFVSRVLGVGLDVAIINIGFLALSALVALVASIFLPDPDGVSEPALAVGAGVWLTTGAAYLLVFWSLVGQTPGMRLAGIEVVADEVGGGIGVRRAFRRLVGTVVSLIPFGLGFIGVLLGDRRRSLADVIADTEVRDTQRPG